MEPGQACEHTFNEAACIPHNTIIDACTDLTNGIDAGTATGPCTGTRTLTGHNMDTRLPRDRPSSFPVLYLPYDDHELVSTCSFCLDVVFVSNCVVLYLSNINARICYSAGLLVF